MNSLKEQFLKRHGFKEKRDANGTEWTGIERVNFPMLIFSIILTCVGFAIIFLNPVSGSSLTATHLDATLIENAIMTAGLLGLLLSLKTLN